MLKKFVISFVCREKLREAVAVECRFEIVKGPRETRKNVKIHFATLTAGVCSDKQSKSHGNVFKWQTATIVRRNFESASVQNVFE